MLLWVALCFKKDIIIIVWCFELLLINLFSQPRVKRDELNFSEFLDLIEKGEVSEVVIQGDNVQGTLLSGKEFKTYNPGYAKLIEDLRAKLFLIVDNDEFHRHVSSGARRMGKKLVDPPIKFSKAVQQAFSKDVKRPRIRT